MVPVQQPHSRQRGVLILLALVLVTSFAGCVDETAERAPPGEGPTGAPGQLAGPADPTDSPPSWAVGDYWVYQPTQGDPATLVVVEDAGTDWIVGTDSKTVSFFHAREEISNLGAQRKSDLAGSQGSDRVQYFQWPLTDGANWTTTWDDVEREIVATANGDGTWDFEASEGGNVTVRYTYDPEVRWFTKLEFLGPDGSIGFGWSLQETGQNWTGETFRWHLEEILRFGEPATLSYSTPPTQFQVPTDATDVWAQFRIGCTQGLIVMGIHPVPWDAGAAGRRWNTGCTDDWSIETSLGSAPGDWNIDFAWQDSSAGDVEGVVYIRTLEPVPLG